MYQRQRETRQNDYIKGMQGKIDKIIQLLLIRFRHSSGHYSKETGHTGRQSEDICSNGEQGEMSLHFVPTHTKKVLFSSKVKHLSIHKVQYDTKNHTESKMPNSAS